MVVCRAYDFDRLFRKVVLEWLFINWPYEGYDVKNLDKENVFRIFPLIQLNTLVDSRQVNTGRMQF